MDRLNERLALLAAGADICPVSPVRRGGHPGQHSDQHKNARDCLLDTPVSAGISLKGLIDYREC